VEGAGNSQQAIRYTWLDTGPLPGLPTTAFARPTVMVPPRSLLWIAVQRGTGPVALLGNPVHDVLTLALPGPMRVDVVDASGRMVFSARAFRRDPAVYRRKAGKPGVYHVITSSGSAVSSQKVVVL
jgi:hypothetical protein